MEQTCLICGHGYPTIKEPVGAEISICPDCAMNNVDNMIVKCNNCLMTTHVPTSKWDRLDFVEKCFMRGMIDVLKPWFMFTGFGMLLFTRICPSCKNSYKDFT